ncbi:MAG: carboxypeptidase regulatory-like domain-containing protein [Thermoproteales archaeon]|nr:carboxypeptidase regulatory-like domain-containing protein [Thermoproteales archaeon]
MGKISTLILFIFITIYMILTPVFVLGDPIRVVTPFGTPMSYAEVHVRKLDGTLIKGTLDENGYIGVSEVPLGIVDLEIVSWRGFLVNYSARVSIYNLTVTCWSIGKLVIHVTTLWGSLVPYASVNVKGSKGSGEYTVGENGVIELELPEGSYQIKVSYSGYIEVVDVTIKGGSETPVVVQMPFLFIIAGVPIDLSRLVGLILLLVAVVFIVAISVYEIRRFLYERKLKQLVVKK